MAAPSMVHRSGDTLIVRSVVSGDQLFLDDCAEPSAEDTFNDNYLDEEVEDFNDDDKDLPQCKIKRNYTCNHCKYFTQNPRHFLTHLRDVHKEKVRIYECPNCLYASKHFQKLLRHMKMVHGSCDGVELPDFSRRRITRERKRKHDDDRSSATEDKDVKPVEPVAMPNDEDDMSKNRISPTELKCSLCTFTTRFQGQLTRHERQEHIKTKFFRCGKCNYVTHIKARYTKHVKYHSMPMIKCDLCDFRTPYKWNLDRHMKNHGGQGAFKCSACNFTADIKQSLTVHEMNHHVPPVGQAAGLGVGRRRNKVGASDIIAAEEAEEIDQRELELLRMEQDDAETAQSSNTYYSMETTSAPQNNNNRSPKLSKRLTSGKKHAYSKEFVNPEDMVQHSNGKVSLKIKCKHCNFKTYSENEMSKHEKSKHNSDLIINETPPPAKKVRRPIPNLIPIQSPVTASVGTLLKIPTLRIISDSKAQESDHMSQKDINDICAKSANSSLKDFASLFGGEDALVSDRENGKESNSMVAVDSSFRKKNASFFDKLKEKLMTNAGESCNLICKHCGHASSCLSESAAHQKNCGKDDEKNNSLPPMVNSLAITSTRCQHCRHRCKSSADLLNHLQTCSEANNSDTQGTSSETNEKIVVPHDIDDEASVDDPQVPHPMENVVFVWNTLPPIADESVKSRIGDEDSLDLSIRTSSPMSESSSVIGCDVTPTFTKKRSPIGDNNDNGKKVFKCPHCSFWASTASRFHVHIVGHLNKKPFECSLCSYRSNWRWDITKHIRLKAVRDPVHEKARVLMTDETGRRNYSKYNKYITLMKVTEPSADSSGSGRRTKAVENMSQGNVPTKKEVNSFSSLPKLTQALIGYRGLEKPNGHSTPLRPPPALKTAEETKKTLFKCKKCNFRDADRNVVLTHVKGHYRDAENQQLQTLHLSGASLTIRPSGVTADSTATDMSVVVKSEQGENDERHCRLKHSGDIRVELGDKCIEDRVINLDNMPPEDTPELPAGTDGKCDKCPYTSASIAALIAHYKQHSPSNDSVFKCYFCPYYVTSKSDLLQHLPLHGISDPEKYFNSRAAAGNSKPEVVSQLKRYQCRRCPYVSNSKSQFMYHKQFHHPLVEGAVFKCGMCSYNVTRRHLLHQHLRVHGVVIPPVKIMKNISKNGETDVESVDEIEEITIGEFDTDIPLVWVSKDNEFKKMYKCRHCSHVDVLRDNISEHEKRHNSISFVEEKILDQGVIQCLVDDSKSDLEQVADISRALLEASDRKNNFNAGDIASLNENIQNFNMEILHFCTFCPARFLHEKEIIIHTKFHNVSSPYRCRCCSYTAKQETQLLAHNTVHMEDYQQKTKQLQEMHITSVNHKQPRTTAIIDGMGLESPVWIAIAEPQKRETGSQICDENDLENVISASKVPNKHYPCDKCPARFYKEALLEYHSSLHGSDSKYKCRFCNYAVKTSVNLIKHEAQHTNGNRDITNDVVQGPDGETMYQSSDANQISIWPTEQSPRILEVDPQFGTLMHGNPKFIYPTYMKNGRRKEKRYKCHKCPSAFEKRDQYKVHLSLHGAKQRYKCEACDYSVKYYANYVQHIRKHQTNGDVQAENKFKPERKLSFDDDTKSDSDQMRNDGPFSKLAVKTMTYPRKPGLSVIDKQTMMIMKERRTSSISVASSKDDDKKLLVRCDRCPFTDSRRDVVDSHSRRHIAVSGVTCTYTCDHCDFSVPQSNTLKDHTKVHYARNKSKAPEAFAKYEQLELTFSAEDREYETLFKDIGVKYKTIRFKPDFNDKTDQWDTGLEKLYLSTKNGELVNDKLAQNIF